MPPTGGTGGSGGTPVLELESLLVRILADATSYLTTSQAVQADIGVLNTALSSLNTGATAAQGAINTITASMTGLTAPTQAARVEIGGLATTLSALGPAIAAASSIPVTPLVNQLNQIGGVSPKFAVVAQGISRMSSGLQRLATVDMNAVLANGPKVIAFLQLFNAVSIQTALNINKIGNGLAGMAKGFAAMAAAGGALPPITNNFNSLTSAGRSAGAGISGLTGRFSQLFSTVYSGNLQMNSMRFTLLGFSAFGVAVFARFDDAITRTMAHMRDWEQQSRGVLEGAAFGISGSSRTSATDIAKGLDILAGSGMSAAMAAKAVAIAETFSVASGMDMVAATRKLTDAQWAFGLASENVEQHYANMNRLGDLFTGIAPRVRSTTQELTEAFSGRFAIAASRMNMSLEESIALLGVYSLQGIKGADASDRAARAITTIGVQAERLAPQWKALNIEVLNPEKKFIGMTAFMTRLDKGFKNLTEMQQLAALQLMGFGPRTIASIQPLVSMTDKMRQLGIETGNVDGIMEKMAAMMRATFLGSLNNLWNNISNLAEIIGKHLAPMLTYIADQVKALTSWFQGLNPAVQRLVVILGVVTVGMLALSPVIKFLTGMLTGLFSLIIGTLSLLVNPIAFIVVIAAGLSFAGGAIRGFFEMFGSMAKEFRGNIDSIAGFFWNFQKNLSVLNFDHVKFAFGYLWSYIKEGFANLWDAVVVGFNIAVDESKIAWRGFIEELKVAWIDVVRFMATKLIEWSPSIAEKLFGDTDKFMAKMNKDFAIQQQIGAKNIRAYETQVRFERLHSVFMNQMGLTKAEADAQILHPETTLAHALKVTSAASRMESYGLINVIAGQNERRSLQERYAESLKLLDLSIPIQAQASNVMGSINKVLTAFDVMRPTPASPLAIGTAGGPMAGVLGQSITRLKPLFDVMAQPFLNMARAFGILPAEHWAIRPGKTFADEAEDLGTPLGKDRPGFKFRQVSENRFMIGGPDAATLDYQQLMLMGELKSGQDSLINILQNGTIKVKNVDPNKPDSEVKFPIVIGPIIPIIGP